MSNVWLRSFNWFTLDSPFLYPTMCHSLFVFVFFSYFRSLFQYSSHMHSRVKQYRFHLLVYLRFKRKFQHLTPIFIANAAVCYLCDSNYNLKISIDSTYKSTARKYSNKRLWMDQWTANDKRPPICFHGYHVHNSVI